MVTLRELVTDTKKEIKNWRKEERLAAKGCRTMPRPPLPPTDRPPHARQLCYVLRLHTVELQRVARPPQEQRPLVHRHASARNMSSAPAAPVASGRIRLDANKSEVRSSRSGRAKGELEWTTHGQCASKKIAASCLSTSPFTLASAATLRSATSSASGLACRRPVTSAAISGRDAKALLTCARSNSEQVLECGPSYMTRSS